MLDLFDFAAGCDSGFGAKPDPRMVLRLLPGDRRSRLEEVAVVGDAVHDLAMGRAAGVGLNVGVLSGTSEREDLEDFADLILPSINELLARPEFGGAAVGLVSSDSADDNAHLSVAARRLRGVDSAERCDPHLRPPPDAPGEGVIAPVEAGEDLQRAETVVHGECALQEAVPGFEDGGRQRLRGRASAASLGGARARHLRPAQPSAASPSPAASRTM